MVCAAVCTTAAAQFKMPEIAGLKALLTNVSKTTKAKAPERPTAKPTEVTIYDWNMGSNEWTLNTSRTIQYWNDASDADSYGRVKEQADKADYGERIKQYTYIDGNVKTEVYIMKDNDGTVISNECTKYYYDEIVKWCCIVEERYKWNNATGEYDILDDVEEMSIIRDENGNVTQIIPTIYDDGSFDEGKPINITYSDGKPVTIKDTDSGLLISDIKWETSNGQIVSTDPMNWILAGSKPLSFIYFDGEQAAKYSFEYPEGYIKTCVSQDPMLVEMSMFGVETGEVYMGRVDAYLTQSNGKLLMASNYFESKTDDFGYQISDIDYTLEDGMYDIERWYVTDTELNADGYPEAEICKVFMVDEEASYPEVEMTPLPFNPSEPPVAGEWNNFKKTVFSKYIDFSGISDIQPDSESDEAPIYYNLQGQRVNNPQNGIYIEKRGSKATKIKL